MIAAHWQPSNPTDIEALCPDKDSRNFSVYYCHWGCLTADAARQLQQSNSSFCTASTGSHLRVVAPSCWMTTASHALGHLVVC